MVNPNDLDEWRFALLRDTLKNNERQLRQDAITCEVVIPGLETVTGSSDWTSVFPPTVQIPPEVADAYGGTTVDTLHYLRTHSGLYGVSFEYTALSVLISRGCILEELEVEIDMDGKRGWGVCVWYKDHPSYHNSRYCKLFPAASPEGFSFLAAMFKTENAGDQEFALVSTGMLVYALFHGPRQFLFDKTLLFRRVVLSLPPQQM